MPKFEDFEELQKQCNEMKSILEFCKNEKENAERHFEKDTKNMQLQINLLSTEKQEMNEKISVIQQGMCKKFKVLFLYCLIECQLNCYFSIICK